MRMDRRLLCVLTTGGIALTYYLWALLAPGITLDAAGLHLTNGQDFLNYWAAPRIAEIDIHQLFDSDAYTRALTQLYGHVHDELHWSYPLHLLFFLTPFASLAYVPALIVWSLSGLALYLGTTWLALPSGRRREATAWLAVSPLVIVELLTRQNGFFISAAAMGVLLLLQHRRPVLAGILLGCLTVKPQLFLLWPLVLLVERQWRALVAASLTTFALVGLSLLVHGLAAWQEFFTIVPAFQWQLVNDPAVFSTHHLYQLMMPGLSPSLRLLGAPDMVVHGAQLLLSVSVTVATLLAWRRPLHFTERALILASASLLVTPYAFNYDMGFFIAALLLMWVERPALRPYQACVRDLAYLLPLLVYVLNALNAPLAPLVLFSTFAATVYGALRRA